jgi:O-acetyl-ADP-ribose deacetylase (regulator of RNase III)
MELKLKIKILKVNLVLACLGLAATLVSGSQADHDTILLPGRKSITLSMGDITQKTGVRGEKTAIVSAANKYMDYVSAGGVAGAIGQLAGRKDLQDMACAQGISRGSGKNRIFCEPGQALLTETSELTNKSFKKQYIDAIIHAVGPDCRIDEENANRVELLKSVYGRIFDAAETAGVQKLYIPGISIAIFACPIQEATPIAIQTAVRRLKASRSLKSVEFVLFDQSTYGVYSAQLAKEFNPSMWQRFKRFWGF